MSRLILRYVAAMLSEAGQSGRLVIYRARYLCEASLDLQASADALEGDL